MEVESSKSKNVCSGRRCKCIPPLTTIGCIVNFLTCCDEICSIAREWMNVECKDVIILCDAGPGETFVRGLVDCIITETYDEGGGIGEEFVLCDY